MTKRAEQTRKRRRRREHMDDNRNLKLFVPEEAKDPEYEYRWVNDVGGRVEQMYHEDWDVVTEEATNDGPEEDKGEGTVIKRPNSSTEESHSVLMRKRKEFYKEDKDAEQRLIAEQEQSMRNSETSDPKAMTGKHAYTPAGHTNVIGRSGSPET